MWKRVFRRSLLVPVSILGIVSMSVSWVLVYKYGWRFTDPLGLAPATFADNESYFLFGFILFSFLFTISFMVSWFIPSDINNGAS